MSGSAKAAAWSSIPLALKLGRAAIAGGREALETRSVGKAMVPNFPPVAGTGTDFPMNQAAAAGPIPQSSPMPSPPVRPIGTPLPASPAPAVGATGTDFPLNQATASTPVPEPQPVPSPPLRPGQDWFQPPKEAATGDAPKQPLIRPSKKGPRVQASLEKNTEPSNVGAMDKPPPPQEFIPGDLAKAKTLLPDGKTVIQKISADGKTATVLRLDMKKGTVVESQIPVRADFSLSDYLKSLKQ